MKPSRNTHSFNRMEVNQQHFNISISPFPSLHFPSPLLPIDTCQSLVARHSVDGEDTVKLLRRVFSHVAASPSSLDGKEIATHIVCREISDMMEVAVICLYLQVTEQRRIKTNTIE